MKRFLQLWAIWTGYIVAALAASFTFFGLLIWLGTRHPVIGFIALGLTVSALAASLAYDEEEN